MTPEESKKACETYDFVYDPDKGIMTLGGVPLQRVYGLQVKIDDPTEPPEVILRIQVDRVNVKYS